ncbi:MAG: hypothetical protein K8T25_18585 [Planctomycetia bacterium]|nr:hypothetical protein [Planctomycetia bacterium]
MIFGYVVTVALEMPVLLLGLSRQHSLRRRVLAALWLNACSYPIVILVLPQILWAPLGRTVYLVVAEIFAPASECALFYLAFLHGTRGSEGFGRSVVRDFATIVLANLISFGPIEIARQIGWVNW